jgi:hypothetical protein
MIFSQREQMSIPADKVGRLSDYGAFQDNVVIGIGADDLQQAGRRYDPGKGANLIGDFRCLEGTQVSFEQQLFPQFRENGFASQGQA